MRFLPGKNRPIGSFDLGKICRLNAGLPARQVRYEPGPQLKALTQMQICRSIAIGMSDGARVAISIGSPPGPHGCRSDHDDTPCVSHQR